MNSKEALERIVDNFGECEVGSRYYDLDFLKDINTIKQDLERKEELEKENQEMKNHIDSEVDFLTNELHEQKERNIDLYRRYEKLKKAIEILKDKSKLILKNDNGYYIECGKYGYLDLTQQEYELLKEVLE